MPQLELISWFFNFLLAWFFLFIVVTILLKINFPSTNYITVTHPQKLNIFNNWLWT
uniref:ATP synthase protein 8 n=2 Tax=Pisaster ochraceus TaxID=7612 RepID=ATP8_PISOC|nr:ATP synthase F0 subunit 8 [Pisaster ochraceus]P25004.1 RecName: Full=ATP synthase protein 8; AltName: Full=A6L; AltName: Full=F-ATPase subunit 8 [Pisaster ochraceus]QCY72415.1 ATP synthase F0 subunit 8 [Pisaster ochraceus]CAA39127.1 ATPase subunit 8 [Pisaster ochraceus]